MKKKRYSEEQEGGQALYAIKRGLTHRRSCMLLNISRSSLMYIRQIPHKDKVVIDAMRRLSGEYPRFGYRRIKILLAREGLSMSIGRCERIWSCAGLQAPKRKRRRINREARQPMKATHPNNCMELWLWHIVPTLPILINFVFHYKMGNVVSYI